MIQNVEQALFCLLSPNKDDKEQLNYCKNCDFNVMCGKVVAILAESRELLEKKPEP